MRKITEIIGKARKAEEPEGKPNNANALTPWHQVSPPNHELTHGTFEVAEFAANLQRVYTGEASATGDGNPAAFFNQTYLTDGIRTLLFNALKRLTGNGGEPVIQTKTGFGGGKTHTLIALYHLVNSIDEFTQETTDSRFNRTRKEILSMINESGWQPETAVEPKIAVLVGTALAPTEETVTKETGAPLNTLWGVMAYQLGGQAAYNLIEKAARRQDSAPLGNQLQLLFKHIGPCVILIDEILPYMRNLPENILGANYSFIQALTESVQRTDNVLLVITLPDSRIEIGGEKGQRVLDTLEHYLGRIEAIWKPLELDEAFEVVRRRLFGNEIDTAERDRTCEAFSKIYKRAKKDFPSGVHEQRYLQRMKACYPIHPEIFDRLHDDWSTLTGFQRTRGVLRLMAICIGRLYQRRDDAPLIMPASLPLDDGKLAAEFEKFLPAGKWGTVLAEADKDGSRVDLIDQEQPRFAKLGGAARRIARTVFLGSCPSGAIKGIDEQQICLGAMQPGHQRSTYIEALNQMTGNLYYLYSEHNRYYFHTEENLNKVAVDRADELTDDDINQQIQREIQEAVGKRTAGVIVCPDEEETILDTQQLRLIILHPNNALPSRAAETDTATKTALNMLQHHGNTERINRNTLLFLAAKTDEIRTLRNSVRNAIAWKSITQGERRIQKLTGERLKQAQAEIRKADEEIRRAIPKAYRWAIAPTQLEPQRNQFAMLTTEVTHMLEDGDIVKNAFETFERKDAVIKYEEPELLNQLLKQYVWNTEEHININDLWNMSTQFVYMRRLSNRAVLIDCIKRGIQKGTFGYATAFDQERQEYRDTYFAQNVPAVEMNGLILKPEIARQKPSLSLDALTPILKENVWDNGHEHIDIQTLWSIMPEHVEEKEVKQQALMDCIEQGVRQGHFGYATGYQQRTYHELLFREQIPPDTITLDGLIVAPKHASEPVYTKAGPKFIVARKTVVGELSLDEINELRQEIIEPLAAGADEVTVEIKITANSKDGFSQNVERSVKENGVQLDVEVNTYSE